MTYDETLKLTALGNKYRELRLEADRVQLELDEVLARKRQLTQRLSEMNRYMAEIVGDVEPIFAGITRDPSPIVVSSVAPCGEKAEA